MVVNFVQSDINEETLKKDLKKLNLYTPTKLERIYRGLNNPSFILDDKYVLKINPRSREQKFRNEEQLIDILSRDKDIKVNKILKIGTKSFGVPYSYLLVRYIPETDLIDKWDKFSVQQQQRVSFKVGKLLAKIHGSDRFQSFPYYGNTLESIDRRFKSWDLFIKNFFQNCIRKAGKINSVPSKLLKKAKKYFTYHQKLIPSDVEKRLIHGDFHFANIRIKGERITGLFDFENAMIGDPEFEYFLEQDDDFAFPIQTKSFMDGYTSVRKFSPHFQKKRAFYKVLHFVNICNIAKTIWQDKKRLDRYIAKLDRLI